MPTFTSVENAVRALYDGPAGAFVATRKALSAEAKAAGDTEASREIAALRRPTAAAEAVNHLDDERMRELFGVGAALRAAQTRLDTPEMKRLSSERQRLLDAAVAGLDVSASVRDEVRSTLLAATSDAGAERAVSSRALVRALQYSGWGDVDLADALAHRDAASRGRGALRVVPSSGPDEATPERPDDVAAPVTRGDASPRASAAPRAKTPKASTPRDETSDGAPTDDAASRGHASQAATDEGAASSSKAERRDARRREKITAAEAEVERAERRLRAATAAYDAAKAARASARTALDDARGRLEALRTS